MQFYHKEHSLTPVFPQCPPYYYPSYSCFFRNIFHFFCWIFSRHAGSRVRDGILDIQFILFCIQTYIIPNSNLQINLITPLSFLICVVLTELFIMDHYNGLKPVATISGVPAELITLQSRRLGSFCRDGF